MKRFQPSAKHEKVTVSIRIEDYKVKELDEIANKVNISRNELICQCLDFAIKNLEFKKENK